MLSTRKRSIAIDISRKLGAGTKRALSGLIATNTEAERGSHVHLRQVFPFRRCDHCDRRSGPWDAVRVRADAGLWRDAFAALSRRHFRTDAATEECAAAGLRLRAGATAA